MGSGSIRFWLMLACLLMTACGREEEASRDIVYSTVAESLATLGLDEISLSVPRLPDSYPTPGRLPAVAAAMQQPLTMIDLSRQLLETDTALQRSAYLSRLIEKLAPGSGATDLDRPTNPDARTVWTRLEKAASGNQKTPPMPAQLAAGTSLSRALRILLSGLALARQQYQTAGGNPTTEEWIAIEKHLIDSIASTSTVPEEYRLSLDEYQKIGARTDTKILTDILLRLLVTVEHVIVDLKKAQPPATTLDWDTPMGRVRVAGTGSDHHTGHFLLLIDLGGNDHYEELGQPYVPGQTSIIIDLEGDDHVVWETAPGPGAGIFGVNLWVDLAGDDRYSGRNLGLGTGLFGAGLLWDEKGNDTYQGISRVQGAAQYGIGVLFDGGGNDTYEANLNSQGYGGTGGYGIHIDMAGNDTYTCNPLVPDQSESRRERSDSEHYISLCQGYGFGRREQASGGIGLLLDRQGNDHYRADLFAQGGAYWFGLGMLVDGDGDDHYQAYEHCQGESLHLGAGFLGDWGGNDEYVGYEHCQGVGIDRAVGILYDDSGNDRYQSHHQSQGAGIKPYGVGLLIDVAGDDHFVAANTSQGYSARPPEDFPEHQWPLGILLDLAGTDTFIQPGVAAPTPDGRVYNRQGIAVKK